MENKNDTPLKLLEALRQFQRECPKVIKGTENPFFHSKYADLPTVIETIQEPLFKNGLTLTQQAINFDTRTILRTTLWHSSGESISSDLPIVAKGTGPQEFFGGLTYCKRYSILTILGLPSEDNDGETAEGRETKINYKEQKEKISDWKSTHAQAPTASLTPVTQPIKGDAQEVEPTEITVKTVEKVESDKVKSGHFYRITDTNNVKRAAFDDAIADICSRSIKANVNVQITVKEGKKGPIIESAEEMVAF